MHQAFVYDIPSIVGGILQNHKGEHTFILSCILFPLLDAYNYFMLFRILVSFIQFLRPPNFAALGDRLFRLVVRLAVGANGFCTAKALSKW
jgi:hypothetical protein